PRPRAARPGVARGRGRLGWRPREGHRRRAAGGAAARRAAVAAGPRRPDPAGAHPSAGPARRAPGRQAAGGGGVMRQRAYTFDPPLEAPVGGELVLLIRAATDGQDGGAKATVETWNGTLLHSDRVTLASDL